MAQLNVLEQYDTANTWFFICSVGALFSVVFSIMGIKWWFRKRVTFEHDTNSTVRGDRSLQDAISVETTGIYRRSFDADGFVDTSTRPKTLPPVKARQNNGGRPILPVRHSFPQDVSLYQKYPEPEEVIEISATYDKVPTSPPTTPISAKLEDLSKPVVIDVHIPEDQSGVIHTNNNLKIPEVHQRLTLENEKHPYETILNEHHQQQKVTHFPRTPSIASSLDKYPQKSEHLWPEKDEPIRNSSTPIYAKVKKQSNAIENVNQDHHLEVLANSDELNECETLIEDAHKMATIINNTEYEKNIVEIDQKYLEERPAAQRVLDEEPIEIHETEIYPYIQKDIDELNQGKRVQDNFQIEITENKVESVTNKVQEHSNDLHQIENDTELKTKFSHIDSPLDATKILSPKPKKFKRGILKNKRAPLPPVSQQTEKDKSIEYSQVLQDNKQTTKSIEIINSEMVVEERRSKEVSFRDRDSMIVPKELYSDEDEEHIIEKPIQVEVKEHLDDKHKMEDDVKITSVTVSECVTVIEVDNKKLEDSDVEAKTESNVVTSKHLQEDEPIEMEHKLLIPINLPDPKDLNETLEERFTSVTEISPKTKSSANDIEETIMEDNNNHTVDNCEEDLELNTKYVENSMDKPVLKEPVPTPRRIGCLKIRNAEPLNLEIATADSWEPQTIIHNNQVLICTPPPQHPPPVLPKSYLSEEEDEETDGEYDENNPPKPPPRVRIYVVNSEEPNDRNVKSILKTRHQEKRVSFNSATADIPKTPETPNTEDVLQLIQADIASAPLTPEGEIPTVVLKSQNQIENEFRLEEISNSDSTVINQQENVEKLHNKLETIDNKIVATTVDTNNSTDIQSNTNDTKNIHDVRIIDYIVKTKESKNSDAEPFISVCEVDSSKKKLVSVLHLDICRANNEYGGIQEIREVKSSFNTTMGQMTPEDITREFQTEQSDIFLLEDTVDVGEIKARELLEETKHVDENKNLLEEKIAMFKALAEEISSQPLHMPETVPKDSVESNSEAEITKTSKEIIKSPNHQILREKDCSRSISLVPEGSNRPKKIVRQLSAPLLSPREALMAQIRAIGEKRQASIDATDQKTPDTNEQKPKKVIKVLQLEEDIECAI